MGNKTAKQASSPTDTQRTEKLYNAVEQCEYSSELAKRVYHLGTPRFTNHGSTASVTITQDGQPTFEFNRDYFDSLHHNEMVFVILHETVHFAFCHSQRRHDRSSALWNIACDLVANAFLLEKVGFGKIISRKFREFLQSAITFENLPIAPVGERLGLTAEQVYDLLCKNLQKVQKNTSKLKACDEHEWSEPDVEGMADQSEAIDRFIDEAQQIFREWLPTWGDRSLGELRAIGEIPDSVDISWDLILSRRIATCLHLAFEQRWAPPNRKIAWLYPEVLLPADHEVERYLLSVLMAIDASGSISQSVLDKLVAVARSIPANRVQLTTISFDAKVYSVDIWAKAPKIWGGGGTSFDAVESFAKQMNKYSDLVVVLTDGLASRSTVQHAERWFWLITGEGTTKNIEGIGQHWAISSPLSASETLLITVKESQNAK